MDRIKQQNKIRIVFLFQKLTSSGFPVRFSSCNLVSRNKNIYSLTKLNQKLTNRGLQGGGSIILKDGCRMGKYSLKGWVQGGEV